MSKLEEYDLEDRQKFLSHDASDPSTNIKIIDPDEAKRVAFNGLSKEEILKYGTNPLWIKIRWAIFILFWLAWFGMLALAVVIVVFTPKCPYRPKQNWWDREVVYQVDVTNFKDSTGDAVGDLNGLLQKLNYFDELGVKVVSLADTLLDPNDSGRVKAELGNEDDLKALKKAFDEKDMHLVIDIPASSLGAKDAEILSKWLNEFVDGVRITKLDQWSVSGEERTQKLNSWINLGEKIFEKTFRPKMVMFYPFTREGKDSPRPQLVIDQSLLGIKDDDLKDYSKFVTKTNFTDATSYILGDYKSKRISDLLPETRFQSVYHGLALLLKGTPILLYGDELEYNQNDKFMKWDNVQPGCGFTNSSSVPNQKCTHTVKHALAAGADTSLLKMYKKLIKLRVSEPSFKWGSMKTNASADKVNVISFVREADRFDGFLIAGNLDNTKHLIDFKLRHGDLPNDATVEYYYAGDGIRSSDFASDKAKVGVDNILIRSGELIVLRFNREAASSDSKEASSSSSSAHG